MQSLVDGALRQMLPSELLAVVGSRTRDRVQRCGCEKRPGPDLVRRAPPTYFRMLRLRTGAEADASRDRTGVRNYGTARELAAEMLRLLPAHGLESLCVGTLIGEDGVVHFTTCEHARSLNEQGLLQCSQCGRFFHGPRGLRDHQLVAHNATYAESVAVARCALSLAEVGVQDGKMLEAAGLGQPMEASAKAALHPGILAAQTNDLAALRALVSAGWCAATFVDLNGSSALEWAAGNGQLEAVRLLVEELGCDPMQPNRGRVGLMRTPLHWACRKGHLDVARYLAPHYPSVDVPMVDGTTPFHYAVYGGQRAVCEWLVGAGADAHALNDHGCNSAQWAALKGNVEMLDYLWTQFALDMALVNKNEHNVMHKACQRGHVEACRWLHCTFPQFQWHRADKSGLLPMDLAEANGHADLVHELAIMMVPRPFGLPACERS